MKDPFEALKKVIATQTKAVDCDTHPEICNIRDNNYPKLEQMVIDYVVASEKIISVQTALAELETELAHV